MNRIFARLILCTGIAVTMAALVPALSPMDIAVQAASSEGCEGGGFSIELPGGPAVAGEIKTSVPGSALGSRFTVRGKYVVFQVVSSTFGVVDYALTGAPNPLDITGGVRTVVFAAKRPTTVGSR